MTWLENDAAAEQRYRRLSALDVTSAGHQPLLEALFDESWRVRRLAADKLASTQQPEQLVPALLEILTRRGETSARNAAATALSHLGLVAVRPLVALLEHADPDQRKFAADILGELGRPEAAPALIASLKDSDLNVRVAAAEALGHTGGPNAWPALVKLLSAPEPLARISGLEALTALDTPPPLPMLVPLLAAPATRRSAWRLLGRVRHRSAFVLVVRALREKSTRDAALIALGGSTAPLPAEVDAELSATLPPVETSAWLQAHLASEDREHRVGALHLVGALQLAELAPHVSEAADGLELAPLSLAVLNRLGTPGLVALLEGTPPALMSLSREGRAVAHDAVIANASPRFVAPLVALLDAGEAELAELAVRALGKSSSAAAITPLLRALGDDDLGQVAARALVSLALTFPREVRTALEGAVDGPLTAQLVHAWANVAGATAAPVLRRALRDESEAVRAAGTQVAAVAPDDAPSLLAMAIVDESARVRRAAARAVVSISNENARRLLERLLTDREPSVVARAATTAMERNDAWAAPRLLELVSHSDQNVVLAALEALVRFGAADDSVLERTLSHADTEVVKLALNEAAAAPIVVTHARRLLDDSRWDVRAAAAQALAVAGGPADLEALHRARGREVEALADDAIASAISVLSSREGRWPS